MKIEIIILIIVFLICCYIDFKTFKIPNKIIYPFILFQIVFVFIKYGFSNGIDSMKSIIIVFLILMPLFAMRMMGAGDIKLYMSISVFVGVGQTFEIILLSIISFSFIYVFILGITRTKEIFTEFFYLIFYKIPLLSKGKNSKIQFSLPILIAFILIELNIISLF